MNPIVTLSTALVGDFAWRAVPVYWGAQVAGAICGTWIAHAMFAVPIIEIGTHVRTGPALWLAESVATIGLLGTIWGCLSYNTSTAASAIAAYIGGAYWFTASTSFANPAVTIARALSDTFAGIRPVDAPGFIAAQFLGMLLVLPVLRKITRAQKLLNS
jgi:glycerol uptake facilitator-like aquaporin